MNMDASNRANGWAAQRKQAIEQAKQNREDRKANLAKVGEMSVAHELPSTHLTRVTSSENQRDYQRPQMDFPLNSRKPATMKYGMSLLDQQPSEEDLIQARTSLRLLKSKMKNSDGFPTMERESNNFMGYNQPQGRMGQGYNNYNDHEQGSNGNYRKVFKPSFNDQDYNQLNKSLNKDLYEIDKTLSQKTKASNYAGPSQGNHNSQAYEPPQQSRNRDYAKPPSGANRNNYDPNPNEDFQDFSSKNIPSRIPKNTASASKAKPSSVYDEDYTASYSKPKYPGNKNAMMGDESPPSRGNYQNYDQKPPQQRSQENPFGKNNFNSAFDKPNNQNRDWQNNNYNNNSYNNNNNNNNNSNRQPYDNRDNDNSNVFSKPNLKKPQPSANPPSYPQKNARPAVNNDDDDFDNRQLKNADSNNGMPSEFAPKNDGPLEECPHGCGRKFNADVIEKHAKICLKVFQSKRKKFDSAEQRQNEDQPEEDYHPKYNPPKGKGSASKASAGGGKSAKWKQQSEAFRANLKAARGAPLSQEEQVKLAQANTEHLVPCPTCGRKFSDQAAARHIPFCQSKTKLDTMKKGGKGKK